MDIGHVGIYGVLFLSLYFEVFLFVSFLERKPQKKNSRPPNHYPSVSIVVPSFNEEKTLEKTVGSLLALNYPRDLLDIIIVDDGSKDKTRSIGERLAKQYSSVR